jgi:multidrug efflux system membrane fusion protein
MSKRLALGITLLLGAPFLLNGCTGKAAKADASAPSSGAADPAGDDAPDAGLALPVVGEPVRKGDLVLTVSTTGQVRSQATAQLKAETNGTVQDVLVRPGARVGRGDTLVRLDPRPFDLAVREAQAALDEAQIRLRGNLISDSIVLGPQGSEEHYKNALALSGVPGAQVRLDQAKLDRERSAILAPFSGVVDQVSVADGERVGPGQDVVRVVDVTHLRVEAQVLEHDLPSIRVGGLAWVTPAASSGEPVMGRIAAILPLVDTIARAGRVIVHLERTSGPADERTSRPLELRTVGPSDRRTVLQPGMYADVRLEARRLAGRTLVPSRAVIERDGRPLVFVVKHQRAQWVYILPGQTNGQETEVLPDSATGQIPVSVGDTVLVEGHLTLTHDAPVRLVTHAEPAP